eukprot:SAG31_NODE_6294_length_2079_cov_1.677273_1_plen_238_part_10
MQHSPVPPFHVKHAEIVSAGFPNNEEKHMCVRVFCLFVCLFSSHGMFSTIGQMDDFVFCNRVFCSHIRAVCRVPLTTARLVEGTENMMELPSEVLTKRLGRPLRSGRLVSITRVNRCNCSGARETLSVHEDYMHMRVEHGSPCWKRKCCPHAIGESEADDTYCLLRDTGFVEAVEDNPIVFPLVKFCLGLGTVVAVVGVLVKWLFNESVIGRRVHDIDFDFGLWAIIAILVGVLVLPL